MYFFVGLPNFDAQDSESSMLGQLLPHLGRTRPKNQRSRFFGWTTERSSTCAFLETGFFQLGEMHFMKIEGLPKWFLKEVVSLASLYDGLLGAKRNAQYGALLKPSAFLLKSIISSGFCCDPRRFWDMIRAIEEHGECYKVIARSQSAYTEFQLRRHSARQKLSRWCKSQVIFQEGTNI